jgi:hypothetical protein
LIIWQSALPYVSSTRFLADSIFLALTSQTMRTATSSRPRNEPMLPEPMLPTPIMAMAMRLLGALCPRTRAGTMLKAEAVAAAALPRRKVLRERFMV